MTLNEQNNAMLQTSQREEQQAMLYKTGDFLALPMAEDDNLSNLSGEDQRQDDFLASMMHVASKPDPSLMQKYRLPIKPIGFVVEDENEDLE